MPRPSASTLAAAGALASLAIAGCGGGDETTSSTATDAGDAPAVTEGSGGPAGPLTASGIGEVEVGASEDEVEAAFGEPIRVADVDFGGGGGEPPQVNWTYRFAKGDVTIKFDTADDTLAAYDVHTPELETEDGFRVGDPFAAVEERYGDDLAKSPLGLDTLVLSESAPGTAEPPALSFARQGKRIATISGGDPVQPAGE